MVAYIFHPSTWEAEVDVCEFEIIAVQKVSTRTAKATQRDHISKTKKQTSNGLMYFAEDSLKQYNTQAESWILFSTFSHVYTENAVKND